MTSNKNDIALIRLSRVVDVTIFVRPACLANPMDEILQVFPLAAQEVAQYPAVDKTCTVTGWGENRSKLDSFP